MGLSKEHWTESQDLHSNFGSSIHLMCDFNQVTFALWTCFSQLFHQWVEVDHP